MKLLLAISAALGALAFWRRASLKEDVGKATDAVKSVPAKVRARAGGDESDAAEGAAEADAGGDAPDTSASEESASAEESSAPAN